MSGTISCNDESTTYSTHWVHGLRMQTLRGLLADTLQPSYFALHSYLLKRLSKKLQSLDLKEEDEYSMKVNHHTGSDRKRQFTSFALTDLVNNLGGWCEHLPRHEKIDMVFLVASWRLYRSKAEKFNTVLLVTFIVKTFITWYRFKQFLFLSSTPAFSSLSGHSSRFWRGVGGALVLHFLVVQGAVAHKRQGKICSGNESSLGK